MMRLRRLNKGPWSVLAVVEGDGSCPVFDELAAMVNVKLTRATANGFFALFSMIPAEGPRKLGTDLYHQVDAEEGIYEFRKGSHRVLCFEAEGRVVICSHVMRKQTRKMPKREVAKALALRRLYLAADTEIE